MDRLEEWLQAHSKLVRNKDKVMPTQQYKCTKCKDSRWVVANVDGCEVWKKCECYALRRAEELMEKSGISAEFLKKSFDNFDTKGYPVLIDAKRKAMNYVKNFTAKEHDKCNSIMFCGQVGAGKTHLGIAICGQLLSMGIPVIYMPYRNVMTKIKQHILDEAVYSREVSIYANARVLYIDDMLKGRLTETDVNVMYEIINHRYMNNLPLIISTEKDLSKLLMFDEAIGSRIIEMCKDDGSIVIFNGKELNYRMNLQSDTRNKSIC